MLTSLSRAALSVCGIAVLGALTALATPVPTPTGSQACDNQPVTYIMPAGTVTGVGTSPGRAQADAGALAALEAGLAASPCKQCPDHTECRFYTSFGWSNYQVSLPVYNPATGMYECIATWGAGTLTQICRPCG